MSQSVTIDGLTDGLLELLELLFATKMKSVMVKWKIFLDRVTGRGVDVRRGSDNVIEENYLTFQNASLSPSQ